MQWDAESIRVEAPSDFLTGGKRRKQHLAGLRPHICSAKTFGLVDGQSEIADLYGRANPP